MTSDSSSRRLEDHEDHEDHHDKSLEDSSCLSCPSCPSRLRDEKSSCRSLLDDMMTPGQRRLSSRPQILEQPLDVFRLLILLPRVVDHDDGSPVARAEALDLEERECAGRIGLARFDAERGANLLGYPLSAV